MKTKILSLLLVLAVALAMLPFTALAITPETVHISISNDAQYVLDPNGNPMAYVGVTLEELASVNLDDYGLSDYWYDADGDGQYEITALHLYIYVHEALLGLNFSDVYITGSAGSIYFAGSLFGFSDENLRYDYNGAYPAVDGWGLTADQIVLSGGDYLNGGLPALAEEPYFEVYYGTAYGALGSDNPPTGDSGTLFLFASVMMLCLFGVVALTTAKKFF